MDERLGLGRGSLSPGLSRVAARLGIEGAFGEGVDVLAEALSVDVAKEGVRRITEGLGAVAEAEQQTLITAARQGEIPPLDADAGHPTVLAVEVDGIMVHTDDAWHEAKVGTVAPLGPDCEVDQDSGRERLEWGRPSYCVGIEPSEDFWFRVYVEACRRGLGTKEVATVVVLADGAEWIWAAADRFLGIDAVEVVEIVDVYHAIEHLWRVANAVFGAGTPKASAWAEPLKRRLLEDGAMPVIMALQQLVVPDALAAEEVRHALGYFTTNAPRMNYPAFVTRQFPIGSGAVESAGKLLVGEREKGAGYPLAGVAGRGPEPKRSPPSARSIAPVAGTPSGRPSRNAVALQCPRNRLSPLPPRNLTLVGRTRSHTCLTMWSMAGASVGPEEGRLLAAIFPGGFARFLERLDDLSAHSATQQEYVALYCEYQSEINGPPLL